MPQQVPTVPASEVPADAVVLDVREDDEWVAGHVEGATHIPMGEVPARLDDLPEGDPLYVTCRGGGRSARVAAWLNANGYDAVNVGGGMGEWQAPPATDGQRDRVSTDGRLTGRPGSSTDGVRSTRSGRSVAAHAAPAARARAQAPATSCTVSPSVSEPARPR